MGDGTAQQAATLFEAYLETERRASKNTISAYRGDLASLLEAVGEDATIGAIDIYALRSWLGGLVRTHAPASIARKIAAVRTWMRFLVRRGHLEKSVAD